MACTRRNVLSSMLSAAGIAFAQRPPRPKTWKPKLGILGQASEANIAFARQEGFTSMGIWANRRTPLDPETATDAAVARIQEMLRRSGLHISVIGCSESHIDPDPQARARANSYFGKVIELAGRLGAPHVGTQTGGMPGRPLAEQVDELVRVYTEKYFPLCQKHHVRILWEPYAGRPNIATGPVGYEALFKAFGDSPYIGLQYDPSHLVWQMMDPIQCARDFVDKIYDVHLKDTEIRWPILRKTGIHPLNNAQWWRFRLPGLGQIDWAAFFTVLMDAGYSGAMNIEHEDPLYGHPNQGVDFTDDYKTGFRVAHQYLRQYVPA
jgi:sugar phosphate isomerase/epimerase